MKNNDYFIRPEEMNDINGIRILNQAAFEKGENEASLVELIRDSEHFIPDLSLVAVDENGDIIGHILFSIISLVTNQGMIPTIGLAPMAVKPEYQNNGFGSALVTAGLKKCKSLGYQHVFVLGHPNFYPKFGFQPSKNFGVQAPFPVPDEVFMAIELEQGSLNGLEGKIEYPPAFNAVS